MVLQYREIVFVVLVLFSAPILSREGKKKRRSTHAYRVGDVWRISGVACPFSSTLSLHLSKLPAARVPSLGYRYSGPLPSQCNKTLLFIRMSLLNWTA